MPVTVYFRDMVGIAVVSFDHVMPSASSTHHCVTFPERVAGPGTSQAQVYAEAVYPVVQKMLDGFNCSVLAYGQTGSGKTFTMEGGLVDPSSVSTKSTTTVVDETAASEDENATATSEIEKAGIIPRAVHTIFREGGGDGTRRYWVYVSHMEIYNERLFDLLAPEAAADTAANNAASSSPAPSPFRRSHRSPTHRSPRIATVSVGGGGGGGGGGIQSPQRSGRSPCGSKFPTRLSSPKNGPRKSSPQDGGGAGANCSRGRGLIIEEDRHLGVMVKGLTQVEVKSPEEIFAIIARSKHNRRTAEVR